VVRDQPGSRVTILLVEQKARTALSVASHGYIIDQGKVVLDGSASELRDNEDVKEFYLGGAGDQRKSFKNLKSFKQGSGCFEERHVRYCTSSLRATRDFT
jgi:ABC-type multidrug transport system ATPase subunit